MRYVMECFGRVCMSKKDKEYFISRSCFTLFSSLSDPRSMESITSASVFLLAYNPLSSYSISCLPIALAFIHRFYSPLAVSPKVILLELNPQLEAESFPPSFFSPPPPSPSSSQSSPRSSSSTFHPPAFSATPSSSSSSSFSAGSSAAKKIVLAYYDPFPCHSKTVKFIYSKKASKKNLVEFVKTLKDVAKLAFKGRIARNVGVFADVIGKKH
uniref:Uncharacterized protein n=1 Tax=Paramoeba aestuarina TaxID=180227 RepID=A0A7S4KPI7_9EUKA|mmetsp:Transcript_22846/g.35544  ORF Transcript_22846/g.35544 Transcript_22846/m.35544 type:complete len:213 (+) Transcript_22846:119-757(+)